MGSVKRFFANIGASLMIIIAVLLGNKSNVLWIDYNATVLGSKLMPWSYVVNSVRYYNYWKLMNEPEIKLEDAEIMRNILYSGVWVRFHNRKNKEHEYDR